MKKIHFQPNYYDYNVDIHFLKNRKDGLSVTSKSQNNEFSVNLSVDKHVRHYRNFSIPSFKKLEFTSTKRFGSESPVPFTRLEN